MQRSARIVFFWLTSRRKIFLLNTEKGENKKNFFPRGSPSMLTSFFSLCSH